MEWGFLPFTVIYTVVVSLLLVYGLNYLYLAVVALRHRAKAPEAPKLETHPMVTVQLPVFNEKYVVKRLIDVVCKFDWPRDRLEIQVLDDSTDNTVEIARQAVEEKAACGIDIKLIHRENRKGYKAGALKEGLEVAKGEFVAIFDADFIPSEDFLKKTIPHFNDAKIGFVQTRWGHINRDYSWLTRLQAIALDGHFAVDQFARNHAGYYMNFNGTAGVWRAKAIHDAGGWSDDTLTEDLDLSYRTFIKGYKAIYLRNVVTYAELPVTMVALRRQQCRWATGLWECAFKLLPVIWKKPDPLAKKIQATFHLSAYSVHLLVLATLLLYPLAAFYAKSHSIINPEFSLTLVFFNLMAFAPLAFLVVAQNEIKTKPLYKVIPEIVVLAVLGSGMMINTLKAFVDALSKRKKVFERTPKFGISANGQSWISKNYQLKISPLVKYELLVMAIAIATSVYALSIGHYPITIYSLLFALGLFSVASTTIYQALSLWLHNRWQIKKQLA